MNCKQFESLLDSYLDDQLAGTWKLEFEAHMVGCQHCGHMLAMMEAVGQIVSDDNPPARLSADFTDRLVEQLEHRTQRAAGARRSRLFVAGSMAASIALVVTTIAAVSWLSSPQRPLSPAEQFAAANSHRSPADQAVQENLKLADQPADMQDVTLPGLLAQTMYRAQETFIELSALRESVVDGARQALIQSIVSTPEVPAANDAGVRTIGQPADQGYDRPGQGSTPGDFQIAPAGTIELI